MLLFVSWGNKFVIIEWPPFDAPTSTHSVLIPLVYLDAVTYISVEISLGLCWRREILRVKGQALFTYCNFFMTLCDMQSSSGNYSMCHQVPMASLLLLVYLSAVSYISVEISLGSVLARRYFKGQR